VLTETEMLTLALRLTEHRCGLAPNADEVKALWAVCNRMKVDGVIFDGLIAGDWLCDIDNTGELRLYRRVRPEEN
jgi:hypothetical protein